MSNERVVVVTGASGNLGAAIARVCAADGWTVAVHYRRNAEVAQEVVRSIQSSGGSAHAFAADLAGDGADERCAALVSDVVAHFGRLDGLVANSADQATGELSDLGEADWLAMFDANLLATTRVVRAALPALGAGAGIVTVSSVEASFAFPRHAHYAASKAALEAFTRSLALEIGPRGMRANAVAPGLIEREGLARAWPEGHSWWSQIAPNRRPVSATEVADAVAYLVGPRAAGINGVVVPVDGGWSASARAPF